MNAKQTPKRRLELRREEELDHPNLSMAHPMGERRPDGSSNPPRIAAQPRVEPLERPKWAQPPREEQPLIPLSLEDWRAEQERQRAAQQPASTRAERLRTRKHSQRIQRRPSPFKVLSFLLLVIFVCGFLGIYLFVAGRSNILILGLDRALEEDTWYSRSDTIILMQTRPISGEVRMLSIPRDLWVGIPGYGENRINTAHYFAEVNAPGTGPKAAMQTVESNFGIKPQHYVRVKLEEFPRLVDAMGGITLELSEPMGGLEAGSHKLDGTEALKFVRDRAGTDDFYRMKQAQVFLGAVIKRLLSPGSWLRMPVIIGTALDLVDTDIPMWQWPRIGVTMLRSYPDKLTTTTLTREQVTPYITADGANVLLPNWEAIWPLVDGLFR
jgi:LCP family protein required for cell wall assembly